MSEFQTALSVLGDKTNYFNENSWRKKNKLYCEI